MILSLLREPAGARPAAGATHAPWQAALDALSTAWRAGKRPGPADIAAFADGLPDAHRVPAEHDLIAAHLRLSWSEGDGQRLEHYPSLRGAATASLAVDEFLARHADPSGDGPDPAEFAARFPDTPGLAEALGACLAGGGRFVRLRRIGGGLSAVHEGRDRRERQSVILKEAPPGGGTGGLALLLREARILSSLNHPSIPRLVAAPGPDGVLATAMHPGRTLGAHLASAAREGFAEQAKSAETLRLVLLRACSALSHAHARGIAHGDLKADHLLLAGDGRVSVIDWGLACRAGDHPPAGSGTPETMAPEQVDRPADARSDVFGLGILLHEILTGAPPLRWESGRRPADWPSRVARQRAFPPPRPAACFPRPLRSICARALSPQPADRHASAEEFALDVDAAFATASGPSPLRRMWGRLFNSRGRRP